MYDDYQLFLDSGSAGDFAHRFGLEALPYYQKIVEHPAYDQFWSAQALDQILAKEPLKTPTMYVTSLYDQEDMYGGVHAYAVTEQKDTANDRNFLVLGPWRHSGVNYDGTTLGPLHLEGNTALQFRREVMQPFLDEHLKDGAPKANTPPVFVYETGTNAWRRLPAWPLSCESGCASTPRRLYLQPGFATVLQRARDGRAAFDEYVSDPAKPVPYQPRPVHFADAPAWQRWLLNDQRFVADRPDVLSYVTAPLTAPLHIGGAPLVNLFASTSGTDSDWVVKLIDVYPDEVPSDLPMSGYQLPIGMDIFRGRYRESLEHPRALAAEQGAGLSLCAAAWRIMCSCPVTASWCRSSRAGSRSMTAIPRATSPTSSSPSRRTTARRPSGCSTRATRPPPSSCRWSQRRSLRAAACARRPRRWRCRRSACRNSVSSGGRG